MSEDSVNRVIRAELKELEKARRILTGRTKRWYRFPLVLMWPLLLAFFVSDMIHVEISFEMQLILILAVFIGDIQSTVDVSNKRIDRIVELTGAEKKLEEKYQSRIRFIAG